jgi:predicted HTH domain antitoxin
MRKAERLKARHLSSHTSSLLEEFHLESFPQLYDGLVKLLPGLIDHPMSRNFSSEFDLESRSLRMSSWGSIGYIFRDKKPFLVGFNVHKIIPDLPKEAWFIEVELEREVIRHALEQTKGKVTPAARLAGMSHQALTYALKTRHKDLFDKRKPPRQSKEKQ